jgi:DNA-directed RNA polymerase subunit RPC12/RpoP
MARRVRVAYNRPALIRCDNCGHSFGALARQKGHTVMGSAQYIWALDDKHLRCERCRSPRVRKVGTS